MDLEALSRVRGQFLGVRPRAAVRQLDLHIDGVGRLKKNNVFVHRLCQGHKSSDERHIWVLEPNQASDDWIDVWVVLSDMVPTHCRYRARQMVCATSSIS